MKKTARGTLAAWTALISLILVALIGCGRPGGGTPAILEAPTGVSAVPHDSQEVRIDWSPVAGATGYDIYWATFPDVTKGTGSPIPDVSAPYIHRGLVNGTPYFYVLVATAPSLESGLSVEVSATPNPLDTSFNRQGWLTGGGLTGGYGDEAAQGICLDGAGRILTTGHAMGPRGDTEMAIWRIREDGSFDADLLGQGYVTHDNAAGGAGDDGGAGIVLDGAGRIHVSGWSRASGPDREDMTAWRYHPNGLLDPSLAGLGWVTHHNAAGGGKEDIAEGIALDAAGRILVVGWSRREGGDDDVVVWRFLDDGSLDLGFNGTGWVSHHNTAGGEKRDRGKGITLDAFGRILVTGSSRGPGGNVDMVVWRFLEDGSLDPDFNTRGWVVHDGAAGGNDRDEGRAIALDGWGRIVVAGLSQSAGGDADLAVWRYLADGTLDPTLDGRGWIVHHDAAGGGRDEVGNALALDWADRILVAGTSTRPTGDDDMVLWRFEIDGSLDSTFNGSGFIALDDAGGGGGDDAGLALALDSLGRILVAGSSLNLAGLREMVVWRFKEPEIRP